METLTLNQWINGSIDQRSAWLKENASLDPHGRRILRWAEYFRSHGATIPDAVLLSAADDGHSVFGRAISRKDAIKIAQQTLKRAEQERLDADANLLSQQPA